MVVVRKRSNAIPFTGPRIEGCHSLLAMVSTACITRIMMDLFSSSLLLMYSKICSIRRSVRDSWSSRYGIRLLLDFLGLSSSSLRAVTARSLSPMESTRSFPRTLVKSLEEQSASDVTFLIVSPVARGRRGIEFFASRFLLPQYFPVCLKRSKKRRVMVSSLKPDKYTLLDRFVGRYPLDFDGTIVAECSQPWLYRWIIGSTYDFRIRCRRKRVDGGGGLFRCHGDAEEFVRIDVLVVDRRCCSIVSEDLVDRAVKGPRYVVRLVSVSVYRIPQFLQQIAVADA